jgi:L-ribulose-5-phosphate 3-epimerase
MLQIGYNTNGFKGFPLCLAIGILAELGYQCVAITIDYFSLNPYQADLARELGAVKELLRQKKMSCVIETGAGFLLDPWRKHEPTLVSQQEPGRQQRLVFLRHAIDIAGELDAKAVSFWAGRKSKDVSDKQAWTWLEEASLRLCDHAASKNIQLAIEPEPGMLVENLSHFEELKERTAGHRLGLTLDLGHAYLTENISPADCIRKNIRHISNIHIEDMRKPIHNHLFFGDGDIDFPAIFDALEQTGYHGPVVVELSRHSHDAVETARNARLFIHQNELHSLRSSRQQQGK